MALEKTSILQAIRDTGGNISKAAHKLNVSRRTLQARMRAYFIPQGQPGRRKKKISYSRKRKMYAIGAAAAAVGAVLLYKRKPVV
jgi:transposase-like protein